MNRTDELFLEVTDQLQMHVFHFYKNEKHSFVEEILTGIAASVVFEFIKPLINFEGLSALAREKLSSIFHRGQLKGNNNQEKIAELEGLLKALPAGTDSLGGPDRLAAEEHIRHYLITLDFPATIAAQQAKALVEVLAKKISQ